MNLPNKLTLLRILLVIPTIIFFCLFSWLEFQEDKNYLNINLNSISQYFLYVNGLLFILSMITDFFDGYLARKNNQITTFGKLFDPLADKIIIATNLIFLAVFNYTYGIFVVIFIIRDLIVDGSRIIMIKNNIKFEANIFGKLKTVFQTIAIIILLFFIPMVGVNEWWKVLLINIPMIVALIISIYSGIIYFKQIIPFLNLKD